MKIIYLHQYFKTPEEGGAIRSYYLAKALVQAGHEVVMITAGNSKRTRVLDIEGIKVHYLPVFYENKLNYGQRILAFLKFSFLASLEALKVKGPDLCYATSTPLTIGLVALWLRQWKGTKFIFEVRDVWPEAPIQLGIIRNRLIISLAKWLEKKIYRSAEKLVALSPGIAEHIRFKTSKEVAIVPNMSDCEFFSLQNRNLMIRQKYDIEEKFVLVYTGSIGKANQLTQLLNLAEVLSPKKYHVLIIGLGAERTQVQKEAETRRLDHVSFVEFQSKFQIRDYLDASDAAYISFATVPILETNSPNKLFDALAAAKLIVTNTKGWAYDLLEEYKCGIYIDGTNPQIEVLEALNSDPQELNQYKKNARRLAEDKFSRKELTKKWLSYVLSSSQ